MVTDWMSNNTDVVLSTLKVSENPNRDSEQDSWFLQEKNTDGKGPQRTGPTKQGSWGSVRSPNIFQYRIVPYFKCTQEHIRDT